jgi:iron complex transport system ATP-binding protein
MAKPRLLILDEPCAGLDPVAREHFLGFLQRLGVQRAAPALLFVTHHVEEIMPIFSHALLLRDGCVLAAGHKAQVLTSSNLTKLFAAQTRLGCRRERYTLRIDSPSCSVL